MNAPSTHAGQLLENAASELERCLQQFLAGEELSLQSFDAAAQAACRAIQQLPKDQALVYKADLEAINHALSILAEKLGEQYGQLKQELQGVDSHRVAHAAYVRNMTKEAE